MFQTQPVILVVEDKEDLRELAKVRLRDAGFRVLTASTAEEVTGAIDDIKTSYAKLVDEVTTDSLTGLDNKERFRQEALQVLRSMVSRGPDVLSLVFIDVDKFKALNKRYGHPAADCILRKIGSVLGEHRSIRPSDRVCRRSGDEFLILLLGVTEKMALRIGARLEKEVEKAEAVKGGFLLIKNFTISFGVAQITRDEVRANSLEKSLEILEARADKEGLYSLESAKEAKEKVAYFQKLKMA